MAFAKARAKAMSSSNIEPVNNFETNLRRSQEVAETRTSRGRRRETTGRYAGVSAVRAPANGLGRPAPSKGVRTAIGAVIDPMGNGLCRIQATINRRVDILENERSHTRISEGAYRTGRILQECFEKLGGVGSTNWSGGSRIDAKTVSDSVAYRSAQSAQEITRLMSRVADRIGMTDARLLRRIIGDRISFAEAASLEGKGSGRGTTYIAERFRDALEEITTAWTAKGAHQPAPDDRHAAAAGTMVERQRSSIVKGVTTARRSEEIREAAKRAEMVRKANPARRG